MNLRTYQAHTMAEALAQVKSDLGRSAVILNTRHVKRGGWLGLGGRQLVEITASTDVNVLHPLARKGKAPAQPKTPPRRGNPLLAATYGQSTPRSDGQLVTEIGLIKKMVGDLVAANKRAAHADLPEELIELHTQLIANEVAEELARELLEQLRRSFSPEQLADREKVRQTLTAALTRMIPTCGPIGQRSGARARVVALIGPTGVGKTTTIAKLAANLKLRQGKRVALMTIDTYRIAAVDQLRTYANIINVPLEVVCSPGELAEAIERHGGCDVILIDTAGRSPKDELKLNELRAFLAAAGPDETHLVISSAAGAKAAAAAAERFAPLAPAGTCRIILTKLDEAVSFGLILSLVGELDAALSYVTTGQDVPDDIAVGEGRQLARLILGEAPRVEGRGSSEKPFEPVTRHSALDTQSALPGRTA